MHEPNDTDSLEQILEFRSPGGPVVPDPLSGLHASHRRIAMLRAADMTITDIARWMECSEETIEKALKLPKVQKLLLKLGAATTDHFRPVIEEVNQLVADTTKEAFDKEVALMRRSFARTESIESEKLCFTITKDIMDRAGAAAPKRLETKNMSLNLGAEDISSIAQVLKELDGI